MTAFGLTHAHSGRICSKTKPERARPRMSLKYQLDRSRIETTISVWLDETVGEMPTRRRNISITAEPETTHQPS
jgi:hypothetical protein